MTSLTVPLERALQVAADDVAIVVAGGGTLTYRELATRARRLGHALRERGLHQGDRVAVAGPNTLGHLELLLSVPLAGMVVVPLNARHTDDELLYALRDSGSRVLFTDRDPTPFRDDVEHVLALEEDYEALVAPGGEEAAWAEGLDRDSLAALFYTGGTTGAAKGVMTTHGGMTSNALHFMSSWPFGPETRWLVAAPLFHAAGSVAVVPTVWTGGTQVLLDAFHPGKVLDLIASERVTDTVLVPTMIAAIIDEQQREPRDVSSWRRLMHGGSPIAMQTLRRCHETFPDLELAEVYGATETGPLLTMFKGEHELLDDPRGRSCGQPIVGVQIRLVDEAWQDV
ncbi:MAG TPA: AMP-binding protein, partial [Baekduia sp.]|nr:AMP-binding protein [Baekduia sp.]